MYYTHLSHMEGAHDNLAAVRRVAYYVPEGHSSSG